MMSNVAIVDYGLCNLDSVARAVEECGGKATITDRVEHVCTATHIILPGVGAFGDAMANLRQSGLDVVMAQQVLEQHIPFLGICLGMQLLATKGEEGGSHQGLGWIPGRVRRLEPHGNDMHIPHIGWNEVHFQRQSDLFRGIPMGEDLYFVHSYHLVCDQPSDVLAITPYCGGFVSAIQRGHIFGVQFHPEKSQRPGFHVLRNFLAQ